VRPTKRGLRELLTLAHPIERVSDAARRARSAPTLWRVPQRCIEHQERLPEREVSRYMTAQSSAAQTRTCSA